MVLTLNMKHLFQVGELSALILKISYLQAKCHKHSGIHTHNNEVLYIQKISLLFGPTPPKKNYCLLLKVDNSFRSDSIQSINVPFFDVWLSNCVAWCHSTSLYIVRNYGAYMFKQRLTFSCSAIYHQQQFCNLQRGKQMYRIIKVFPLQVHVQHHVYLKTMQLL